VLPDPNTIVLHVPYANDPSDEASRRAARDFWVRSVRINPRLRSGMTSDVPDLPLMSNQSTVKLTRFRAVMLRRVPSGSAVRRHNSGVCRAPNVAIPFFELKREILMNWVRSSMQIALQLGAMLLVAMPVAAQTPSPA